MTLTEDKSATPRIALIHGTPAAIAPAVAGMTTVFPGAEVWNILDDKLLPDADAQGGLTPHLVDRMNRLIDLALADGAAGVLLTCSMYGSLAHATTADVPVLSPDEAAFETALAGNYGTILVVASFESALNDSVARFATFLQENGSATQVVGEPVPAAFVATKAGDDSRADRGPDRSGKALRRLRRRGAARSVLAGPRGRRPRGSARRSGDLRPTGRGAEAEVGGHRVLGSLRLRETTQTVRMRGRILGVVATPIIVGVAPTVSRLTNGSAGRRTYPQH